jgi:antitoxin FitA
MALPYWNAERSIKNVPTDVHRVLRGRASEAGQSLQEYLLALLEEQARAPTLREVLERAGNRAGGSVPLTEAAEQLRTQRDAR